MNSKGSISLIRKKGEKVFAGIHLAGTSGAKTSVVLMCCDPLESDPPKVVRVYEKIGFKGRIFSDERLIQILSSIDELGEVFVDCPLTHPPCVSCTRSVCPGVWKCEDVAVAYMLHLSEQIKEQTKLKRKRPINPQTQRLWDVLRVLEFEGGEAGEVSYNSNIAPLVNRARTLEKQLKNTFPDLIVGETSVPQTLHALQPIINMSDDIVSKYRNFETGKQIRTKIIEAMIEQRLVELPHFNGFIDQILSVENFSAFITSWVSSQKSLGNAALPPDNYVTEEGWVYLPRFERCS